MANIGTGFSDYIATRPSQSNPAVQEFYDTKSGQGFSDPSKLAGYANLIAGRNDINEQNVFGTLQQGFTPRAQALSQITDSLNAHQTSLFNTQQNAPQRASSALTDSIATADLEYEASIKQYKDLVTKAGSLTAPNYEQAYNELSTAQGLPQINSDLAANDKAIRELPYVNRMNSGNAGVQTEGQLGADTQQKGIPLEIQQANLIDRLKLASNFIETSLNLKEKDFATSQDALNNAIKLVGTTIDLSRTQLDDLQGKQKDQDSKLQQETERQQSAQQFAFENRISKPFYEIGGTVYRTGDRMPIHNKEEYVSMGGVGDFSDVQKLNVDQLMESLAPQGSTSTSRSTSKASTSVKPRGNAATTEETFEFTKTQLAKGASAAGVPLDEFEALDPDIKNEYVNGQYKDLENGRLSDKDFDDLQAEIDAEFEDGTGLGDIRTLIDDADIPQEDKEELKQYAESTGKGREGFFNKLLKKLNPFS